jgi:hypothetical protein
MVEFALNVCRKGDRSVVEKAQARGLDCVLCRVRGGDLVHADVVDFEMRQSLRL